MTVDSFCVQAKQSALEMAKQRLVTANPSAEGIASLTEQIRAVEEEKARLKRKMKAAGEKW